MVLQPQHAEKAWRPRLQLRKCEIETWGETQNALQIHHGFNIGMQLGTG
jgi:hypothetical protein